VLTPMQRSVLLYLASLPGQTVSRQQLLDHMYADRREPEQRILNVFMAHLRNRLDLRPDQLILTVWGCGYCFDPRAVDPTTAGQDKPSLIQQSTQLALPARTEPMRWTPSRRKQVVEAIQAKMISETAAAKHYNIPLGDIQHWIKSFGIYGYPGLTQRHMILQRR
jgi:DNA-binding winged helix-turn-helix (wHTH) protein